MSIASQLYQLQEVDSQLGSDEKALAQVTRQLGDNKVLIEAQGRLDAARKQLEGISKEQRSIEWEIDDLTAKIKTVDEKLYGGRIRNPKELTDLQAESNELKAWRSKLEDKELDIMERLEKVEAEVAKDVSELTKLETGWQIQQKQLAADLERLKNSIANLKQNRVALVASIESQFLAVYEALRKQRPVAVVKVERGLCSGCRIALPVSESQKARSGELVKCGSCGRILYLA